MGFWPVVIKLIQKVDIVGVVVDSRMPELSMNEGVMEWIHKSRKPYVIIFTKRDLVSKDAFVKLKKDHPEAIFVAGSKNIGVSALKKHLLIMGKRLSLPEPIVGFVGYPNVGKSALINALAHGKRAVVSNVPGTTKGIQWVKAGSLRILDSPGVIPLEDKNTKLALLGAKSVDKMRSPEQSAYAIIEELQVTDPEILGKYYGIADLPKDPSEVLLAIGKKRNYLLKGGIIDERRAAVSLIRDWQSGKLGIR